MMRADNGDFLSARRRYEQLRRSLWAGLCLGFGIATIAYPFLVFPSPEILAVTTTQFIVVGLFITLGAGIISRKTCATSDAVMSVALVAVITAAIFCLITTLGCP
jgi:hypothetical protein